jgi:DNA-binding response OmpR family regulator
VPLRRRSAPARYRVIKPGTQRPAVERDDTDRQPVLTLRHRIEVDGKQVHVTRTEFWLLALLASEPERVFDRREIMRHVWESDFVGDLRNVNVHVRNLRRKIERTPEAPERLVSVPGIGYQLLPA